jgi:LysM repeat protein
MNSPRYYNLFKLPSDDYIGWAKGLKKAGYATVHDYDKRLIKIIEDYQLYRLDYRINFNQLTASTNTDFKNNRVSNRLMINPYNVHVINEVNGIQSVVANEGDTYEIIAQEMGLKPWELCKFNDQPKGYQPMKNEIVYVEQKNKKTSRRIKTHTVRANESMHYISQVYGIRLRPLYRRNNMKYGEQPQIGQLVNLHKKAK